ncbi:Carbonic anhydrase 2 [Parachlamydia acanthamoebae]|nr:Carbonic anhydrase 2 [Parachlamydia acanthamoebae]
MLTYVKGAPMNLNAIYSFLAFMLMLSAIGCALTPDEAIQRLMEGNQRYVKDQLLHPDRNLIRREAIGSRQEPFAVILGCADSRVSPEIIFDQGIGDLFIVRVAGNVAGPVEVDSIDFSAEYLHSSVILVLGHESCGAVNAVLNKQTQDIEAVAALIEPAIQSVRGKEGDLLANAVKANVRAIVAQLKETSVVKRLMKENKIKVIGGYYELVSGKVVLLD